MEAMAHGKVVLAPDITGIPELVRNGATGFLYRAGSLEDFVKQVELIAGSGYALQPLRRAAREHVLQHFNREKNVKAFCGLLVSHLCNSQKLVAHCNSTTARTSYENPLLQ
jgi:glycosyltransferase involved in cell wall biosynthesis